MNQHLKRVAKIVVVVGLSAIALGCTPSPKLYLLNEIAAAKSRGASEEEVLRLELEYRKGVMDEKIGFFAAGTAVQDGVYGTGDERMQERAAGFRSLFLAFTVEGKRIVAIRKKLAVIEASKNVQNTVSKNITNSPRIPAIPSTPQPCGADSDCSI